MQHKIKKLVHSFGHLVDVTTFKKRVITGYFIPSNKKQDLLDLQNSTKNSPKLTNDKYSPKPINGKYSPKLTNDKQQKLTTVTQTQNYKSQPHKLKKLKSDFKRY